MTNTNTDTARCACGITLKAHAGKSRRNQLPDLKTDRFGRPRPGPGRRTSRDTGRFVGGYRVFSDGSYREDFGSDR